MRERARWAFLLVLVAVKLAIFSAPAAAVMAFDEIKQPVSDELRGPLTQFLRELGVTDIETMIQNTKTDRLAVSDRSEALVLRIDDKRTCSREPQVRIARNVLCGEISFPGRRAWPGIPWPAHRPAFCPDAQSNPP